MYPISCNFPLVLVLSALANLCQDFNKVDKTLEDLFPKNSKSRTQSKTKVKSKEELGADKVQITGRNKLLRMPKAISKAEKENNQEEKASLNAKLKAFAIQARNSHVQKSLARAYEEVLSGTLKVFCVDNQAYQDAAKQGNSAKAGINTSGIPKLRLFCHRISTDAQILELQSFLSRLDQVANSIMLWNCSSNIGLSQETFEKRLTASKMSIVSSVSHLKSHPLTRPV